LHFILECVYIIKNKAPYIKRKLEIELKCEMPFRAGGAIVEYQNETDIVLVVKKT
jgi:hypothetical protein